MKLSDYARQRDICYRTAWNRYELGKIPGAYRDDTGHVIVPEIQPAMGDCRVAVYARVSSSENKSNLDAQAERLVRYATARGWQGTSVVKEVGSGSGVNDHRKKLQKLLSGGGWDVLLVEHKDCLTRFGFNHFDILLTALGRRIEVANRAEDSKTDLVQDLVAVIYSFSARMYGQRRAKRQTEALIQTLESAA